MPEVTLNLSAWIERRKASVGPYADHVIHSVKAYETEIQRLREIIADALNEDDAPAFVNDGKCEERWVEDVKNACPCCTGSGHRDDVWKPISSAPTGFDIIAADRNGHRKIIDWGNFCEHNQPGFMHWTHVPGAPVTPNRK
jgi:hypothetical protein